MNDLITHTHSGGSMTEVLAFEKAVKQAPTMKLKILQEIELAGDHGLTPDEFVEMHGGLINTVRRRFTDLWKDGEIRHHPTGATRKNTSGNACVAWVVGEDPKLGMPKEAVMSEYIRGFDAGCDYILHEIERWIDKHSDSRDTVAPVTWLVAHLKSEGKK